MSARRFKKERHPFANRSGPGAGSSSNSSTTSSNDAHERDIIPTTQPASTEMNRKPAPNPVAWTPEIRTAVKLLLSSRLCSVVWSHITDCDETFNYWEPLHYILHKSGFQTWEYSPDYAIRSYTYLLLHALPLKLYDLLFHADRLLMFYLLRLFLAVISVGIEGYFYHAVTKKFGPSVGRLVLVFQLFAPGFFISTTAFLPSSFALFMTTLAFACWFMDRGNCAITAVACSGLLGWPFAGILGLPIALDIMKRKGLFHFITRSVLIGGAIAGIMIYIDSSFYGKFAFPTLNIVLYNVISGHGPELYGTEPWHFYIINGFLNFNIVFFLALLSPLISIAAYIYFGRARHTVWNSAGNPRAWTFLLGCTISVAILFGILFATPHKEERFLFPVYSLLIVLAASMLELALRMVTKISTKFIHPREVYRVVTGLTLVVLTVFALLGTSRMFALSKFYGAPMEIYTKLHMEAANRTVKGGNSVNLCVGKEWYRFPSSFFLPDHWQLQFIQSEFKGVLPKPFAHYPEGLSMIPTEMNDANKEEPSRYIDVCRCDYLVDLQLDGKSTPLEPQFSKKKDEWTIAHQAKFLDAEHSDRVYRAFYIPFLSEKYCRFGDYVLLRRKRKCLAERSL